MKKVKIMKFVCSYCGNEFFEEEKCEECEAFHDKVKRVLPHNESDYMSPKKTGAIPQPKSIIVEMTNGRQVSYKFDKVIAEPVENEEEAPVEETFSWEG